jgi:uncharacterized membrane protein YkvA (DUF1232 family)
VLTAALIVLAAYAALVLALVVIGRRGQARALAGFVPDCARLFTRLVKDDRIPRRRKWPIALMAAYLASPIDLVPDFIPVAGQLDDAIVAALVLRAVVRRAGPDLLAEHWPGPAQSLAVVARVATGRAQGSAVAGDARLRS